jgi:hypothetical protein
MEPVCCNQAGELTEAVPGDCNSFCPTSLQQL